MSKRTFQSTEKPASSVPYDHPPTDLPVAVYYRQSTTPQVGNISTSMQTLDMVAEMERRGWTKDQINLIDMDAGVSGTLRIDEREGMSQLFDLIASGSVGAVACQDEDRLFRDVTQIQVNIFIDVCARKQVQVITPSITYVFHHPTMGEFYKKQFRFKSEVAAEYLNFLKMRLGGARDRLRREGKYSGGRVPLGYMVDWDKDSKTFRKYIIWREMAEIVVLIFEVFVEAGGRAYRAATLLRQRGIKYPADILERVPAGYLFTGAGGGDSGFITAQAIRLIVTNPSYLGHWMYKGAVVRWNNHDPIIDPDLFFRAFNFVSSHNLDGSDNHNYRPVTEKSVLKSRPERTGTEPPLLTGLLFVFHRRKWRRLGMRWLPTRRYYEYVFRKGGQGYDLHAHRKADLIDAAVDFHLYERVRDSFRGDVFAETYNSRRKNASSRSDRIASLEQQKSDTVVAMTHTHNLALIRDLEQQYERIEAELQRTHAEANAVQPRAVNHAQFERVLSVWTKLTRDKRRGVAEQFIERVEILQWEGRIMRLAIRWHEGDATECEVWLRRGNARWSYADQITLIRLIEMGAPREEVMEALPGRSWDAIRKCLQRFGRK